MDINPPPCSRQHKTCSVTVFRKVERKSPFDRALEVGLADRAVVDEYGRAGAVLFGQEARGHLRRDEMIV